MYILIGALVAAIVAMVAYKKNSLSISGVIFAIILGTGIFIFGGVTQFILMMVFFITSSLLSKYKKNSKSYLEALHEKGDARDWMQVVANGGVALLFLVLYYINSNYNYFVAAAVSFAASNADTWASELGVLSKGKTISIVNFKEIKKGLSGGVSLFGTFSSLMGAISIAITFGIINIISRVNVSNVLMYIFIIAIFGFLGSIVDSFLGATVQGHYLDNSTGKETEKKKSNGNNNKLAKGFKIINNDIVNLLSNLIVTVIATIILNLIFY